MKISGILPQQALQALQQEQVRQSRTKAGVDSLANGAGASKQSLLLSKVEKHLDDVSKGKGNLSQDTGKAIQSKKGETGDLLSRLSPADFKTYNSVLSALSYQTRARFIVGVEESVKTAQKLSRLV
ncbi:MAG: hypothetical protein KDD64_15545 [Bdellovibrionales bacterium]|nr:hypothetical protein [Bdellovibrionales bacterium]